MQNTVLSCSQRRQNLRSGMLMSQELILDFRALVLGGRSCMFEAITSGVVLRNRERLKKRFFSSGSRPLMVIFCFPIISKTSPLAFTMDLFCSISCSRCWCTCSIMFGPPSRCVKEWLFFDKRCEGLYLASVLLINSGFHFRFIPLIFLKYKINRE